MDGTEYLALLGRVLIGLPFVMSGLGKLATYGPVTAKISEAGLPLAPLGWLIAVVIELGGGLLLLLGFRPGGLGSSVGKKLKIILYERKVM